tara:strand:- start:208 stop:660 length:453 start_codon:yes stop_codon:yes gene_type:complete
MKKTIIYIFIFIFFSSCGYAPVYSNKNLNFNLIEIVKFENNKLNSIFERKLRKFSNKESEKLIFLKINSQKEIKIITRDVRGDPSRYEMIVKLEINIIHNKNEKLKKIFQKEFNYNTNSNKFTLNQYEKEIEELLIKKVIEELVRYLGKI